MSPSLGASRLFRKAGWNLVDQALSALSNVLLSVIVARSVSILGFGAFSTAFVLFGIGIAIVRAGVGQPLQINFSAAAPEARVAAARRALGCAVAMGLTATVLSAVAGFALGGQLGSALLALAVVFPALLVQDACRGAMFAFGRPAAAALVDGTWAVVQVALLITVIAIGRTDVAALILAWGASAAISAALALSLLKVVPSVRDGWSWLRGERKLTKYLLAEYVLGLGASQLGILLVGVIASTSAVGYLRAAAVLLGPLGIVGAAAFQFAIPEIARRPELSARKRMLFAIGISGALGLLTAVYVVLLLLLPDSAGVALFGSSWAGASSVLLAMGLSSLASAISNGPSGVLYGMGQAQYTFRINLAKGPLLIVVVIATTLQWGVEGAAWGLAAVEAAVLPSWWWTLHSAVRRMAASPPAEPDLPSSDGTLPPPLLPESHHQS